MKTMQWRVDVGKAAAGAPVWPARVSIPLPCGQAAALFGVKRPDGSRVAAQARTLVAWPDGSPRWVQLDFQANQAGPHEVALGEAPASLSLPLTMARRGKGFRVSVGRLELTLDPAGASPVAELAWEGRPLTAGPAPFRFVAYDEQGREFPAVPAPDARLAVEAEGPQRFQVSWEARHADAAGAPLLDIRFRLELLAGLEGFSLSYQFFHKLPHHDFLRLRGLRGAFRFAGLAGESGEALVSQEAYGELWVRRLVRTRGEVPILLDRTRSAPYVEDGPAALNDQVRYPYFLMPTPARTVSSAVALADARVAVACTMRDFLQQRPKTLHVRPGVVEVGIWPERAGLLTLPQGRSCRQVFHFRFFPPASEEVAAALARPAACLAEPAVCWLAAPDSAPAGDTWDLPRALTGREPGAAFLSGFLTRGAQQWATVADMFHYGDSPDPGYMMTYAPLGRTPAAEGGERALHIRGDLAGLHGLLHRPEHQAAVWTNNEYDAIYCVALEALRSRQPALLERLRAAARHQIEVDFVHYSDHWQHHRSTPAHSFDHVLGTASIPSHQWTQGLYYYYAITGDDDVPEVVRAICDYDLMHINRPDLADAQQFDRELGWTILALVFGYELTADARYRDAAGEVIRRLLGLARQTDGEAYERAHPSSRRLTIEGLGGGFNVNTIPLAVKAFHQATGEDWAFRLLEEWAGLGLKNFQDRSTGAKITELFFDTVCYVCEKTGRRAVLEESLWHLLLFFRGFNAAGWVPEGDRPLSTKQFVRVYRGLLPYASALARAGLLEGAMREVFGERFV